MERENAKRTYSRFGLSYTLMYFAYIAVILLIMGVAKLVNGGRSISETGFMIANFASRFLLIYPLMYIAVRNCPKFEIPKKNLGVGGFLACYCILAALAYISNFCGIILNGIIGRLTGQGSVNPIIDVISSMSPMVQFVVAVVLAPIFEELLFRKFLIDRVVNYGEVPAMVLSGLMFGLYHGNLAQFVYAATIGMFMAYIYIRTGKIWYTIAFHMIFNGFSTFVATVVLKGVNINQIMNYLENDDMEGYMAFVYANYRIFALAGIFGMFIIFVVLAGIGLMIALRKKFVFEHHPEELPENEKFRTIILNPGMIIYIIFWVSSIVMVQLGVSLFDQIRTLLHL